MSFLLKKGGRNLTGLGKRLASTCNPRLSAFEERWLKLTQAEKDQIAAEYETLQRSDWKSLTIDQKKIRKKIKLQGFVLIAA